MKFSDEFIGNIADELHLGALDNEEWKPIFIDGELTDYAVSNYGRIRNVKRGSSVIVYAAKRHHRKLKGYVRVSLRHNGISKSYAVHRLVAQAFIPNPENKPQVNHKDGNKQNNHVSNLEWATNSENIRHAIDSGLLVYPQGEDHKNTKFTNAQAHAACKMMEDNVPMTDIAKRLGVTYAFLIGIRFGDNWKSIASQYNIARNWTNKHRTPEQIAIIDDLIRKGVRDKSVIYKAAGLEKDSANYNYIKWRIRLFTESQQAIAGSTTIDQPDQGQ